MKSSPSRRGVILAVLAGVCLLPSVSTAAITVVGTGADSSFLVLESPNLGVRSYEVHYTYNSGSSQDTYFLLSVVLSADPLLTAGVGNFGTSSAPNYYVNSFTYNSVTETSVSAPPYIPYWAQWVSGGTGFQDSNYNYDPGAAPAGIWSSGYGISTHLVAPGSWDALFYSDGNTQPSVVPVPETSSVMLGVVGVLVIFRRRRNG